jgi:hypothetical protein
MSMPPLAAVAHAGTIGAVSTGARRRLWLPAIVLGAVAIAFGSTLTFGFVWDDHFLIGDSYLIRSWRSLPTIFATHFWAGHADWRMYYRPLINVSYLVDYHVWGLNPFGYHLTNVLLHAAVCLAVAALVRRMLGDWTMALATALLFAIHPVHSQSVSFIAGRTDLASTLFVVLALTSYHSWRHAEGARSLRYAGALGAFLLALLSKENAITLPAVLVVYEWAFPAARGGSLLRRLALGVGPMLAVLAAFLVIRVAVLSDVLLNVPARTWADIVPRVLTTISMAGWYGAVMLVPYPVSPSQGRELVLSWRSPEFLVAAPALLLLLAATALLLRRTRRGGFFACWFWLTLAPSVALTLIPGTLPVAADRFLYLPSVGVCTLVVMACRTRLGDFRSLLEGTRSKLPVLALGVAALCLTVLTLWRNEYWKDDLRLYYRMADTDPRSVIATLNLGLVHLNRSEPAEAGQLLDRARELAPDNPRVLVGYGLLRAETGHPDEGLELALRGLGREPMEPSLHGLVARIYVIRNEFDKASAHYREAVRLQPHVPGHHFTLSFTLLKAGRIQPAIRAFEDGMERERQMNWHHPLIDRLGGELYTTVDPARAIGHWERYASALRATVDPGAETKAELAIVDGELAKLRGRRR